MVENIINNLCFVMAPMDHHASDERSLNDAILDQIIKPAMKLVGYNAMRADELNLSGQITPQVIQAIYNAPMAIADLRGYNPNVLYELSVRHASKKSCIQLKAEGEKLPFNIDNVGTISYDPTDKTTWARALLQVQGQAESLKNQENMRTPFPDNLKLMDDKFDYHSGGSELSSLIKTINELVSEFTTLQNKLSEPEAILPRSYIRSMLKTGFDEIKLRELRNEVWDLASALSNFSMTILESSPRVDILKYRIAHFIKKIDRLLMTGDTD